MDDDWQIEAAHEQFDVFEELTSSNVHTSLTDVSSICYKVHTVLEQYFKSNSEKKSTRHIILEILKNAPENREGQLSFSIIVINEEYNNSLSKMPIFIINHGCVSIFIDTNCSVFKTWESFMEKNDLPSCQFCFPVGGQYNVGGMLKIDFALSPARHSVRRVVELARFTVPACLVVAYSFFFEIAPVCFKVAENVLTIVEKFLSSQLKTNLRNLVDLAKLVKQFRDGNLPSSQLITDALKIFQNTSHNFEASLIEVWSDLKVTFRHIYNYMCKILSNAFKFASNASRRAFLAIVSRFDSDISDLRSESEIQLARQRDEIADPTQNSSTVNPEADNISTAALQASLNIENKPEGQVERLFGNCLTECVLQHGMMMTVEKDSQQSAHKITQDLLTLTSNVANLIGKNDLNQIKDIFEKLSSIFKDDYKNKMKTYLEMVIAANSASTHGIDLDKFNATLGIVGNVSDHYMEKALHSLQESRLFGSIWEKTKEYKNQKKIFLVPMFKAPVDDSGFYQIVGIQGAGIFSTDELLAVLNESLINLDVKTLKMSETCNGILIWCKEITILVQHQLDVASNWCKSLAFVCKNA